MVSGHTSTIGGADATGDIANLATALSFVVATLAFLLSLIERNARERSAEVLKWQRVVVYHCV